MTSVINSLNWLRRFISAPAKYAEEREKIMEKLRYQADLLENVSDAVIATDENFCITSWNAAAVKTYGWSAEEAIGKHADELLHSEFVEMSREEAGKQLFAHGNLRVEVVHHDRQGGKHFVLANVSLVKDRDGKVVGTVGVLRDITKSKQREEERKLTIDFFHLINQSTGLDELMENIADLFHQTSGCDAVGIRLRDGVDYPFYEARGFSPEFLALECCLWTLQADGTPMCDPQGKPLLACTCGQLLNSAKGLSSKSFFWTNDAEELLSSLPEKERTALRGRCINAGYQSIALIPFELMGQPFGLLQFNSFKKNQFTRQKIDLWKQLGSQFAVAIRKFQVEQELLASHERLEQIVATRTEKLCEANEKLREQEERLRTLSDNLNGVAYQLIRLKDGRMRLEYVSAGLEKIYGVPVSSAIADPYKFLEWIHPDDLQRLLKSGNEAALALRPIDLEGRVILPSGEIRWLNWRSTPRFLPNGDVVTYGLAFDITERKKSAAIINELASSYQLITNITTDGFLEVDEQGRIISANDKCCEMYGFSHDEILQKSLHDFEIAHSPEKIREYIGKIKLAGYACFETRHRCRSGIIKDIEVSTTYHPGRNTLLAFLKDITERKAEEEAMLRANRTLQVLKECDEAVVRAVKESDLLEKICNIIVSVGGAKDAWVGFLDASKQVLNYAAGGNKIIFERMPLMQGNKEMIGPISATVRNGELDGCQDISKDPRMSPWREEYLKLDIASLVSFPLIFEKRCVGVLVIFSDRVNAFHIEEVELFNQLAGDISYGISALRARNESSRLQNELLVISEREKMIISQELHDGLCQNLAGTALMAAMLQKRLTARGDADAGHAKQISDMLCHNVNEARNLSHGLHPVGPEGEGLMNALSQLAESVTNLFHIGCFFRCPDPVILENEVVSTHLFRITQEAINNARKHGEASRILISLMDDTKEITLTIRDNGVGFPLGSAKKTGLGMKTMNYRANQIGATLVIQRAGKKGTVVKCIVPR